MPTTRRNRDIVRGQPCLVCGRYGVDIAHHPVRRSHGAHYGLHEIIPLCRFHHRLLDDNVAPWPEIIAPLAEEFQKRMCSCYNEPYPEPDERTEYDG